jgi:predicted small secreted protein
MKRAIPVFVLCLLGMGVLVGCQTTKGLGKDIQHASEATERAIKGD